MKQLSNDDMAFALVVMRKVAAMPCGYRDTKTANLKRKAAKFIKKHDKERSKGIGR